MSANGRRDAVIVAGHLGDVSVAESHLGDLDAGVRAAALGAMHRCGALSDGQLDRAIGDDDAGVRRRAVELAAKRPEVDLLGVLADDDPTVVEVAAWACGERKAVSDDVLDRLVELTTDAPDALVREAGAAALGAIGDDRGLPAVLAACDDKPHVRRRAVLALAPFEGDEVEAVLDRALADRDWQVRQAAEDLRRAEAGVDPG